MRRGILLSFCLVICGGAFAEHVEVRYLEGNMVVPAAGEIVDTEGDVLTLLVNDGGGQRFVRIPFGMLREVGGEAAPLAIGRWRAKADGGGAITGVEKYRGEMISIVYDSGSGRRSVFGEVLIRRGPTIMVKTVVGQAAEVLLLKEDVLSVNGSPAEEAFARWDPDGSKEPPAGHIKLRFEQGSAVSTAWARIVSRDLKRVLASVPLEGGVHELVLPWDRIVSIGDENLGDALAAFRAEVADQICPDCKGATIVLKCDQCKGSSWVSDKWYKCSACNGKGTAPCRAFGCSHGRRPCTGKCLKLSEGVWEANWKGTRYRKFHYGRGLFIPFSEEDAGKIIGTVDGIPRIVGICEVCEGKGSLECNACNGTGLTVCRACRGVGEVADPATRAPCTSCIEGRMICKTCNDTGLVAPANK